MEKWKKAFGQFGKYYLVSNLGNIKRYKTRNGKEIEHLLKPNLSGWGYPQIGLDDGEKFNTYPVHKVVAKTWKSKSETKERNEVNHINAIKTDNRTKNLEWVSHSENVRHIHQLRAAAGNPIRKKRIHNYLEKTPQSIRNWMINLRLKGLSYSKIANFFDMDRREVSYLIKMEEEKYA
jgi:hypothetical protein